MCFSNNGQITLDVLAYVQAQSEAPEPRKVSHCNPRLADNEQDSHREIETHREIHPTNGLLAHQNGFRPTTCMNR